MRNRRRLHRLNTGEAPVAIRRAGHACAEQLENRLLLSQTVAAATAVGPAVSGVSAPPVYSAGGSSYLLYLTYGDSSGIDASSLGGGNIRIKADNGFNQPAAFLTDTASPDGTQITAAYRLNAPGGTWDASDSGTYSIVVQASQVRNTSGAYVPAGTVGSFNVAIAGTPFQPDLSPASDTGVSSHDKITSLNNASVSGELSFTIGNTLPGAVVSLFSDGVQIGSTIATASTTTITTDGSTTLTDGAHAISADQVGLDGKTTSTSAALPVTVDTTPPAAPAAPVLDPVSDTGVSNSDGITTVTTPTLDISATSYHRVYRDGVLVSGPADTATTYTSPALPDGTYHFTVTSVDAAGNESAPSAPAVVVIDHVAPTATGNFPRITAPGGSSYTFTVTYSDNIAVDVSSLGNGNIVVTNHSTLATIPAQLVSVDLSSNGSPRTATYSINAPGGTWTSAADGQYDVMLQSSQVRDVAGNFMPGGRLGAFGVAADGLSQPQLSAFTDSGLSNSDGITNFNNSSPAKALVFKVANTLPGAVVSIYSDGTLIGSTTASDTVTFVGTDGVTVVPDGVHSITARQTPSGGTQSPDSPSLSITIDTTPPQAPAAPVLDAGSDSGISKTDGITNVGNPTFDVTASEAGTLHLEGYGLDGGGFSTTATGPGSYPIDFAPPFSYAPQSAVSVATGDFPILTAADFNGDGMSDLLVLSETDGTASVLFGNSNGVFTRGPVTSISTFPEQVVTADFNADGKPDFAVSFNGGTAVYLGAGDGTFTQSAFLPKSGALMVSDLNHDGKQDLLIGGTGLAIYNGNGDGTFQPPINELPNQYMSPFLADVNGDGIPDLVSGQGWFVSFGMGGEQFSNPAPIPNFSNGTQVRLGAMADFDRDGHPDLVSVNSFDQTHSNLYVDWGDGTGSFALPGTAIPVAYNVTSVYVGDFNGDGKLDIAAVSQSTPGMVTIAYGNGDRTFQTPVSYDTASAQATTLAVGDFNGDGRPDLAVGGHGWGGVQLLLGTHGLLRDGTHKFYAWAEDAAGNRSANSPDTTITIDQTPPTAALTAPDVTTAGASSYSFTVTYSDATAVNTSTIGNSNIVVTGPNGFSANATVGSVSANPDTSHITVTYQITPPSGSWVMADTGIYTIRMQPAQVADTVGNSVPSGPLGYFRASIATIPAKPVLLAATDSGAYIQDGVTYFNNSSPARALQFSIGGTLPGATVTIYADGAPIGSAVATGSATTITTDGVTTLSDGVHQITARQQAPSAPQTVDSPPVTITIDTVAPAAPAAPVLDPSSDTGTSHTDGITSVTTPTFDVSSGSPFFRVYLGGVLVSSPYASGSRFTSAALPNGTYQFQLSAVDAAGNESALSAAITVVIDTVPPRVQSASLPSITTAGGGTYAFSITYSDLAAVAISSLSGTNVTVTGPNSFSQAASFVSVDNSTDGSPRTATYQINAPGGTWLNTADGTYTVQLNANQVSDVAGNTTPSSNVGTFTVNVASTSSAVITSQPPAPLASRRPRTSAASVSGMATAAVADPAQSAATTGTLLKDIDPRTAAASVSQIFNLNGVAYLVESDPAGGFDLWRSDGAPDGTLKLSTFAVPPYFMGSIGNVGLFSMNGAALWRTDGTVDGTYQIKTMQASGYGVTINNLTFFNGNDPASNTGSELWETDGTAAGTQIVKDIVPGAGGSTPDQLTNVFGTLFFTTRMSNGLQLWKSDGTAAGTLLVTDFSFAYRIDGMVNAGGTLYVAAYQSDGNEAIWSSDGTTTGTVLVKELPDGGVSDNVTQMIDVDGRLYFSTYGGSLWTSDGTSVGTVALGTGLAPTKLTTIGGELYFVANGDQLWKSDGSQPGTQEVTALGQMGNLTVLGNELLFSAADPKSGNELWSSDGTTAGTQLLKDINPGPGSSSVSMMTLVGNELYFLADDGLHGIEPWRTDGTAAGTVLVDDTNPTPLSSSPHAFTSFDHSAFFLASGPAGNGIYKSDGTPDGTVFLAQTNNVTLPVLNNALYYLWNNTLYRSDGNPGDGAEVFAFPAGAGYVGMANGVMFFTTYNASGSELWRSDGTATGTYALPVLPGTNTSFFQITAAQNFLFFYVTNGGSYAQGWVSDGTVSGTHVLAQASKAFYMLNTITPAVVAAAATDHVVFINNSGEYWSTDGTDAGTVPLKDPASNLTIDTELGTPQLFTMMVSSNGMVYFLGSSSSTAGPYAGMSLYRTDGTQAALVKLNSMPNPATPYDLINAGGRIYFANQYYYGPGFDLWTSDGTPGGTLLLKGFYSDPGSFTPVGQSIYFTAQGTSGGPMLVWTSDGTASGTVSLPPGSTIPGPSSGVVVDGSYLYAGTDATHGTELWIQPTATLPTPPATPSNLTATPVGQGQVKLTFTDNATNDSSLRIERSTDPNFATVDQTFVLVPGTTQYVDTRATGAATYYYRIYAVNLGGQSAYSSTAAASFGSISGQVFQDANHSGAQDSGETGLAGVSVYLDLNGNGVLDSTDPVAVTDANGVYTFADVAPGTYSVREVLPAGYGQTAPTTAAGSVAVTSLQNATGPTFGDVAISSVTMDLSWLLTITRNFGKPGVFGTGDLNGDGTVNLADFLLLSRNFGHALPTGSAASAATSPSSNSAAATARRRATV